MKAKFWLILAALLFIPCFTVAVSAQSWTFHFKEEFVYSSMNQMIAAGWTLDNAHAISMAGDTLILDGTVGDCGVHYAKITDSVYDWKAETKGMWLGKGHSVLTVALATERHSYGWTVDGYYDYFSFYRDSNKILTFGSYAEAANQYVVLAMVKQGNTISFYFNGALMNTYTEEDTTPAKVTRLDLVGPWEADAKYDYYLLEGASSSNPNSSPGQSATSAFPIVPIAVGGGVAAIVIGGILVYYFFIAGGGTTVSAGAGAGTAAGAGAAAGGGSSGGSGAGASAANELLKPPLQTQTGESGGFIQASLNAPTKPSTEVCSPGVCSPDPASQPVIDPNGPPCQAPPTGENVIDPSNLPPEHQGGVCTPPPEDQPVIDPNGPPCQDPLTTQDKPPFDMPPGGSGACTSASGQEPVIDPNGPPCQAPPTDEDTNATQLAKPKAKKR